MTAQATAAHHKSDEVVARLERLPISWWHVRTRIIIGVATFFDAFDALTIAFVLPVLVPMWKLAPQQIGLLISAGFAGQLVGAIFFGWVAGRYGRIMAMVWAIGIFGVMSLACAFAWSYESLLIFRILQGIGLGGEVPIAAAYIAELSKADRRGRFVLLYELVFPVGLVCAGFIGALVVPWLGWQTMFYIGAIPALLVLVLQRLLPESPRWLASQGRDAEAEQALARIEAETERSIGKPLPPPKQVVATVHKKASFADLFGPAYLYRTLVVWMIWFVAYLVNYSIAVWLPTIYRTVFKLPLAQSLQYGLITQVVGLLGAAVCALTIDKLGRRPWFAIAFAGVAICFIGLASQGTDSPQRVLTFVSIGFFFVSVLSIGVYVYTPELYPTRARAVGVGTATAWLRLASMIGPTVVGMTITEGLDRVFLVFGAMAAVAAVLTALFAVETKGRVLEELSP